MHLPMHSGRILDETRPVSQVCYVHNSSSQARGLRQRCRAKASQPHDSYPNEDGIAPQHMPDTVPLAGADTDWREFSQKYFQRAVLFLFEHSDRGSAALILNRPTAHTIATIGPAVDRLCPEFADNILYLGGDVGRDTVHMLHGYEGLQEAVPVVGGVYMGGFDAALNMVREGRAKPRDFKWYSRYAGWAPSQLQRECDQGYWFPVAASSNVILNQGSTNMSGLWMWHQVLELMGGEFAKLSQEVKEQYKPF